jgi:hypothetical protein
MGSSVLSTDLLVNTYLKPALNAYVFGHYNTCANLLFTFNSFLRKFRSVGIDDMPKPPRMAEIQKTTDLKARTRISNEHFIQCKLYSDQWLPMISGALGLYQDKILKAIANREEYN